MKVHPITNNQPVHKGYVDKSLKTFIDEAVLEECNKILCAANENKRDVNASLLQDVYQKGQTVLEKMGTFIKPMHKDTYIGMSKYGQLKIYNPITKEDITIMHPFIRALDGLSASKKYLYVNVIDVFDRQKPNSEDLGYLEAIAEHLKAAVTTKDIDKAFLEIAEQKLHSSIRKNFNSFFGRLKDKIALNRLEKYEKETGLQEYGVRQNAKELESKVKKAEIENKQREQAEKELQKANKKVLDEILSGK